MKIPSCEEFNSRRSPIYSSRGMAASSQPLATMAGIKILDAGGNAADAAVAVAAALQVTEPCSTGLGGDCFCLYYDAAAKKVHALNGSGASPAALDLQLITRMDMLGGVPPYHPFNVTVPGAPAGWVDTVARFGTMRLSEILAPAIEMAEEGFPVAPLTAAAWSGGVERQLSLHRNGHELTIDGRGPKAGEIFRNPGLARCFRLLANEGKTPFYTGEIADRIVQAVQEAGGVLGSSDLATHESDWVEPISVDYRGVRVWECPPNGQGLAALIALNLLKQFEPSPPLVANPDWYHLMIECMRLAFADTARHVADPRHTLIPLDQLLSDAYAEDRASLIEMKRTHPRPSHGDFSVGGVGSDTVYFATSDRWGNGCSFINSNYLGFGSGIVPQGCGYSLQNRGNGFVLEPGHPNVLAPSKRPYHTIIPGLATDNLSGDLFAVFGVMGDFMQPQGHLQLMSWLVDGGLDPQAALDIPRFRLADGKPTDAVQIEWPADSVMAVDLQARGHRTESVAGSRRGVFGRGQVICAVADGVMCAGSDPRADGCAMGL